MSERTHVAKRYHSGGSSIVLYGNEGQCRTKADALNVQYQTDEYRVEAYRLHPLDAAPWHPHFDALDTTHSGRRQHD